MSTEQTTKQSAFSSNIKKLRKSQGLKGYEMAQLLKKTPTEISAYENGKSGYTDDLISRLTEAFPELNLNWLLSGRGAMFFDWTAENGTAGENTAVADALGGQTQEMVAIASPENAAASAGVGLEVYDEGLTTEYLIPAELLRDNFVNPRRVRIFRVRGDSMEPTYNRGCLALLDIEDCSVRSGCAYLIRQGETFYFKRIAFISESEVEMLSENPRYRPIVLKLADAEPIKIIGRVFASLHLE